MSKIGGMMFKRLRKCVKKKLENKDQRKMFRIIQKMKKKRKKTAQKSVINGLKQCPELGTFLSGIEYTRQNLCPRLGTKTCIVNYQFLMK